MPNIIPAGWFAWLAENLMRASPTVENPDTPQWMVTPLFVQCDMICKHCGVSNDLLERIQSKETKPQVGWLACLSGGDCICGAP
jgi:hypothetical protein